jgi:hypothetical protein
MSEKPIRITGADINLLVMVKIQVILSAKTSIIAFDFATTQFVLWTKVHLPEVFWIGSKYQEKLP